MTGLFEVEQYVFNYDRLLPIRQNQTDLEMSYHQLFFLIIEARFLFYSGNRRFHIEIIEGAKRELSHGMVVIRLSFLVQTECILYVMKLTMIPKLS